MELYPEFHSPAFRFKNFRREQQLVVAAAMGDILQIKYLLNLGVSVNAEEYISSLFCDFENHMTPLQTACDKNQVETVKLLIEAGAKINAKGRNGVAAIHIAAEKGYILCLRELLSAGAEYNAPTKDLTGGYLPTIFHSGGMTPLHFAAARDKIDCVVELIHAGADYNATDYKGRTSLYIAAESGFEDCVLAHLRNAIGQNFLSVPSVASGNTPLYYAVKNGMTKCVKELLKFGSDPNHLNFLGLSPLHCALNAASYLGLSSEEILKLLVLNGRNIDVNKPDASGHTPLHYVCFTSKIDIGFNSHVSFARRPDLAQFLITYGANPLIMNEQGFSIIECEMSECDGDHRILNAVIQSMLQLPSFHSLNIPPPDSLSTSFEGFFSFEYYMDANPGQGYDGEVRPMEQEFSLLDPPSNTSTSQVHRDDIVEKYQWYKLIASQPRTLKHYCRYQIRASLGHRRLGHIKDLRIAPLLQKYLLFETEEF